MSTIIGEPRVNYRAETPTLGIRTRTPFKGMFKVADKLFKELYAWAKQHGITPAGPSFLRLHVIDMAGEMDIEVGFPVSAPGERAAPEELAAPVAAAAAGDGRVQPGTLPAGRYASLVYSGSGLQGNKALLGWGKENGLAWDRWQDPRGDAFRARYESYLTDPKLEPRKTKWQVELAIKLRDEDVGNGEP